MKTPIQFVLVLLMLPCAYGFSQTTDATGGVQRSVESDSEVQETRLQPAVLGEATNVHRLDDLFFSGQFNQEDIAVIKDENIARVISLRTDGEIDWDEKAALESAGIEFTCVPFREPESLTDEVFDEIRGLLRDQTRKTLFHCGSANRVGGVWLTYRVLDEGVELETALAEAKEIGLKTPFIEEKALDYIKRKQAPPEMGGEASVKPGVNKDFVDPDLDVDSYVKKFEIESRALKPDGTLIVIDFERIEGQSRDWLIGHVRAGKEVFRAEIQDAGFTLVEEKKIDGFEENYFLQFRKN